MTVTAREPETSGSRGLLANSVALAASRIVVAALGWAGTLIVVRVLSVSDFGRFNFVFGLLGLVSIVTNFGVGRLLLSRLGPDSDDAAEFAGAYTTLRATLGLVGYAMAVAYVVLADYDATVITATAVAGLVVVIATPSRAIDTIFRARLRLPVVAAADVIGQTVQFGLLLGLALWKPILVVLILPVIGCEIVSIGVKLARLRGVLRPRFAVVLPLWKEQLKDAVLLTVGKSLETLYYKIDLVLLSALGSFTAVGIYGIAYKFADIIAVLVSATLAPVTTVLVRSWPADLPAFQRVGRQAFVVASLATSLFAVEFVIFAEPVIRLFYGESYVAGVGADRLVVLGACLGGLSVLAVTILVASGHQGRYALAAVAGAAINIGLNVVLIPAHSYRGAAIATLVTEGAVAAFLWVSVLRIPGMTRAVSPLRLLGAIGCAAAAGAAGAAVTRIAPWPVGIVVTAVVYLALIVALRVPGSEIMRPRALRSRS